MKYSSEVLENLYRTMVRIRYCEESLVELILNSEILTPCHLYSGQEAVATGVCAALKKEDMIFGNHRSHGHYLAKGGSLEELIAEIYCKRSGCSRGRGGSMHVIAPEVNMMGSAPIVSGTISLAVGAALASNIRQDKRISVTFFGDGAAGEGSLYESMNFAALNKLPVIFVCENNYYSTHMPIKECRPDIDIYDIGKTFGIKSFQVDGNDVLKVYETARKAVENCRKGDGPVFMECLTYRLRGHVGPNDNIQGNHTDIRPIKEIEDWKKRDPIIAFENYLLASNVFTEDDINEIKKNINEEVEAAIELAKESLFPSESELANYVFK